MESRSGAPRLAELQRQLRRLVTAPDGAAAALAADRSEAERRLAPWIAGDGAAGALGRLEVYAHAYFERIHDVLREDHGALAAALGGDAFHDLVTAYLMIHPPRRPSLRFAGAALADFLAADDAAAPFRRRAPWAADLARLEWALVEAFDAADAEPLPREALADLAPTAWAGLRLRFRPGAALLRLDWPVAALREAWERDAPPAPPAAPRPTAVWVWRRGERPCFRTPEPVEAALLEAALAGEPFGELCARAAEILGDEAAPAAAAEALGRWTADGLLAAGPDQARPRASATSHAAP